MIDIGSRSIYTHISTQIVHFDAFIRIWLPAKSWPKFWTLRSLGIKSWPRAAQRSSQSDSGLWCVQTVCVVSDHEDLPHGQCRLCTVVWSPRLPPGLACTEDVADIRAQITVTMPGRQRCKTCKSPVVSGKPWQKSDKERRSRHPGPDHRDDAGTSML